MSDIAIRVENLSKLYRIGGSQVRYKTLRETAAYTFKNSMKYIGLNTQNRRDRREKSKFETRPQIFWLRGDF